ncbi:MAG TPA: 2,5-didehydrogluconate reductase DkgB [Geminicoccaceae bacterium]|nr:2,5-didehydrogluconate reductase DkgB [Geminicoccaceae bacterium]
MSAPAEQAAIPRLGLGTYGRTGEAGEASILDALELGYRHLDTAQTYDTEAAVGRAVERSGIARDEIFITTKVGDINLGHDRFMPSLRESLDNLRVDRIDLTLIHWPSAKDAVPFRDYMQALARAQADGMTRLIGVSNFPIALLRKAEDLLGPGAIVNNQVELHPYFQNRKLRGWCREHGVSVTAYMPLAKGRVASDPVLQRLAARHGATPAQVALAFLLQQDIIVIPASSSRENLRANLAALALSLPPADMAEIEALDRGERMIDPEKAPVWD